MLMPGSLSLMKGGFPALQSSSLISRTFLAQTFPWMRCFSSCRFRKRERVSYQRRENNSITLFYSFLLRSTLVFYFGTKRSMFTFAAVTTVSSTQIYIQQYFQQLGNKSGTIHRFLPGSSWPGQAVQPPPASTGCLSSSCSSLSRCPVNQTSHTPVP